MTQEEDGIASNNVKIKFLPFRNLNDFILDSNFGLPQFNDLKKWNNRVLTNLLYFQTNYFIVFAAIFLIFSVFQSQEIIFGILAVIVTVLTTLFSFTQLDKIKQFRSKYPYAVLVVIVAAGFFFISQLASVITLAIAVLLPTFIVLMHASLRLRKFSAKVNIQMENANLRSTVMGFFLQKILGIELNTLI